ECASKKLTGSVIRRRNASSRKSSTTFRPTQRMAKEEMKPAKALIASNPTSISGNRLSLVESLLTNPSSVTILMVARKPVLVAEKTASPRMLIQNTTQYRLAYFSSLRYRVLALRSAGTVGFLDFMVLLDEVLV